MIVEFQSNKHDNIFMQSMIFIRKQDRGVIKKRSIERKFGNKMRHVCEEDDCYLDKYCPFKINSPGRER